jgi:hypothetical protein
LCTLQGTFIFADITRQCAERNLGFPELTLQCIFARFRAGDFPADTLHIPLQLLQLLPGQLFLRLCRGPYRQA